MGKKTFGDDDDLVSLLPKGDFLIQILVWLPVVSLLRFKLVCKSWLALIESSFFIDLHTATTSSSSSKFGSFILHASVDKRTSYEIVREHELFMLSESKSESESGSCGRRWFWSGGYTDITGRAADEPDGFDDQVFKVDDDDIDLVLKLDNLGFPPCYKFGGHTAIVGSCNGLVCLCSRHTNQVTLWNPATRQFRHLPKNTTPSEDSEGFLRTLVSFGFDVETQDYKVMLLTRFRPSYYHCGPTGSMPTECLCRVEVYSLSTDSWSLLEGITSLPGHPFAGVSNEVLYLNGGCFFLAKFFHTEQQPYFPENDRFLISFDFTEGIITTIQLPDHHIGQDLYLTYFGEKIALYISEYFKLVDDIDDGYDCNYGYAYDYGDDYGDGDGDGDTGICSYKDDDDDTGICSYEDDDDTRICSYEDFNIWVLNEHGSISSSSTNMESWKKLHSFRIEHKIRGDWNFPRGISNDGKFALLETKCSDGLRKKMKLYNLVTKEVKKEFLFCNIVMSKANAYKPSLVSI